MGRLSFQARAGLHGASGASLHYVGGDGAEAIRFPGSERMIELSGGASVVLATGSRLDLAVVSDRFRTVMSASATLRF
jgi:hypothetical protein